MNTERIYRVSFRPYLYARVNRRGLCKISIRLIVNRNSTYIPLNLEVKPEFWDDTIYRVKKSSPNSNELNLIINRSLGQVNDIIIKYRLKQLPISGKLIKREFDSSYNSDDFLAFFYDHMWNHIRLTQSRTAYTNYLAALNKLKRCFKEVYFKDLNYDFILSYDKFLKSVDKNSPSTVNKYHAKVKAIINIAIKKGYEIKNPYSNFKLQKFPTRPSFLSIEETKQLLEYYESGKLAVNEKEYLRSFLFSCFTSLRYSDVREFRIDLIKENEIIIKPKKTERLDKVVNIPLTNKARELIIWDKFSRQFDLPIESGKVNMQLKKIGKKIDLKKKITFHVARHTFATTFLELGGKVEVLKEILNHSSIVDTMVYVHITSKQKEKQMSAFDREF